MKLGRNQQIAVAGFGASLCIGLGLVLAGMLSAKEWLDAALLSVQTVIGLGAAVNVATALRGGSKQT